MGTSCKLLVECSICSATMKCGGTASQHTIYATPRNHHGVRCTNWMLDALPAPPSPHSHALVNRYEPNLVYSYAVKNNEPPWLRSKSQLILQKSKIVNELHLFLTLPTKSYSKKQIQQVFDFGKAYVFLELPLLIIHAPFAKIYHLCVASKFF